MRKVIGRVIDEVQTSFVKGRNILDRSIIIDEICVEDKKIKKKMFIFKFDFDKAFDSIN